FFDLFESGHQNISSPNDDGEGPSDDAGEVIVDHQSTDTAEDNRTDDDNPVCDNIRRSSRMSKLPNKLNDFMLDNKVKYGLNRMDVNNAFLYGDLTEDVYMIPPPGFFDKNEKKSKNDHSLFVKNKDGLFLALLVYVDDIVITGNNNDEISKFKAFLNHKFKIKDLGELKFFLGIKVLKMKNGLCLNQRKYYIDLLHEYGLLACKPIATPMPENGVLSHKETDNDNQHMHSPLQSHFEDALRVLRYLKSAPGAGIVYTKSNNKAVSAYADSDWAKCRMTRTLI
ncbi:ribonuclease H-like domain-containing protein, partial [Tanacetum coccineum]